MTAPDHPYPVRPAGTWRVVTWNIWSHFGPDPARRASAIEASLRAVDPDIVCLQEVYADQGGADDADRFAAALGFRVVRTRPDPAAAETLGNAVLSRWAILDHGEAALPDATGRPGHRRAVWARVDSPFGVVPVVSTHLAYRFDESAVRRDQVDAVLDLVARLRGDPATDPPVVVAGDLNAVPDSDELRRLTGRSAAPVAGLVLTDAWPQVRDDPGHTWVRRNPWLADSVWPQRRLDYVLISWPRPAPLGNPAQAFLVGDGPVDGVWPSDHLGVGVDLRST
jgi:endonuclease/exonuclease/phosphatase family metal-dependent hydrolase